jgi:hypothetical protein
MKLMPVAIAIVSLATGAALTAAPAAAASKTHTMVISSCTKATYKPHQYILTCADAYTQIHHAKYSSWSANGASGHGTFVYNTCVPNCAAGKMKHHPVTFTLGRVRTAGGKKLFTRMYVDYAGLSETFQLPTSKV